MLYRDAGKYVIRPLGVSTEKLNATIKSLWDTAILEQLMKRGPFRRREIVGLNGKSIERSAGVSVKIIG